MAELLAVLARYEQGVSSERLLLDLYGDAGRRGSLKALVSRVRTVLAFPGPPYRLPKGVSVDVTSVRRDLARGALVPAVMAYRGPLLPESDAPAVVEYREELEEMMRQAVLAEGDAWLVRRLSDAIPDDLELAERAVRVCHARETAYPRLRARVRRLERAYGFTRPREAGGKGRQRSAA